MEHEHGNARMVHDHVVTSKHKGHLTSDFLRKFWIVFIVTIPILLYSEIFAQLSVWQPPQFIGVRYAMLVLGSFVFVYGGSVFLKGAYREIKAQLPGMMTLVALAISAAYLFSFYAVIVGNPHTLFAELSTLIAIMLLGHWIEMKAVQSTQGALKEIAKLLPDVAERLVQKSKVESQKGDAQFKNKTELVSLRMLMAGDMVLVRPGAKVPADGVVVEGQSELNESIITGESKLVAKKKGDEVIAGSLNGDGGIIVKVQKIGEDTFLAGVMRLVSDAEMSKSRLQILSDRAAFYLTVIAIFSSAISFIVWLLTGAGVAIATERLVAVLVIACPHALGLAVPLVASISTTMAARNGFLVRERRALESAREIDMVLFDKTGTLTEGTFGVSAVIPATFFTEQDVLINAASLNNDSEHPLAKAIVLEARKRNIVPQVVKNFERIAGKGARGDTDGGIVISGNETLMREYSIVLPQEILLQTHIHENEGKTAIFIASSGSLVGAIVLADVIREESREAIRELHRMGIRTAMVTGDAPDVAAFVARELGIDEYFARVLPSEKAEKVKMLQERKHKVAMVGDGVNDAPALTQADLGVAIGAGTNVAIESAGIVLVKNDPRDMVKIIRLSQLTRTKMLQNLFWATGYNVVALPLAAGVLVPWGIILEPAVGAILMTMSTVIVAINALFLRRKILIT